MKFITSTYMFATITTTLQKNQPHTTTISITGPCERVSTPTGVTLAAITGYGIPVVRNNGKTIVFTSDRIGDTSDQIRASHNDLYRTVTRYVHPVRNTKEKTGEVIS